MTNRITVPGSSHRCRLNDENSRTKVQNVHPLSAETGKVNRYKAYGVFDMDNHLKLTGSLLSVILHERA